MDCFVVHGVVPSRKTGYLLTAESNSVVRQDQELGCTGIAGTAAWLLLDSHANRAWEHWPSHGHGQWWQTTRFYHARFCEYTRVAWTSAAAALFRTTCRIGYDGMRV